MRIIVRLHEIAERDKKKKEQSYFSVRNAENVPEFIKNGLTKKVEEFYDFTSYMEKNGVNLNHYDIHGRTNHDGKEYWVMFNKDNQSGFIEVDPNEIPVVKRRVNVLYYNTVDEVSLSTNERTNLMLDDDKVSPFIWNKEGLIELSSMYFQNEGKIKVQKIIDEFVNDKHFAEIEFDENLF